MALKNPLGMIKDVAAGSLKAGLAVPGKAVGVVGSLVGGRPGAPAEPKQPEQPEQPEPVNVTEELGLDPAPVTKPKSAKKSAKPKPVTSIDAAADPSSVDVTPADVAEVIGNGPAGPNPAS